jgi:hypothetical protein
VEAELEWNGNCASSLNARLLECLCCGWQVDEHSLRTVRNLALASFLKPGNERLVLRVQQPDGATAPYAPRRPRRC